MAEETPIPLDRLRGLTQARIALGRVGQALPTGAMLDFQLAHARARDAVSAELRTDGFAEAIGREVIQVASQAGDPVTYLRRPDLGRRLDPADAGRLPRTGADAALIVGDGLSATAVHHHAASLLLALFERLEGWSLAPVVLARHARVALGDEIGAALGARMALVLIGERPGLSAPDSLGAYLTWAPRRGRLDSERNCLSNIRPPHGLGYAAAADRIVALMREAQRLELTGVKLNSDALTGPEPPPTR
ncbi:ethanolamine ammonia-lyase subunit EutC [Flavisphingomonas formosensis]|uniref:ethanolamine ammonia-lyase subunit EutC n=1 Tax=Flavisphingomonas formosensis TaxID=861534 RepID=UPI0012FA1C09|nr:ethanolamine ammonia-lyase subunit EutC [Sphingomonas formosensis]